MGVEQSCCVKRDQGKESVSGVTKTISKAGRGNENGHVPEPVQPQQEKVGVGVYFAASSAEPGTLQVKSIIKGSPAFRSQKIQVGDVVMSVDGHSVVGSNLAGLAELLLGKPGTHVKLSFRKKGGEAYDVTLERGI